MNQVDSMITRAVLDVLNEWEDRPCAIALEAGQRKPINYAMIMQQLSGSVVLRKYIDGSFIGAWPFTVVVRVAGTDTSKRLDSVGILNDLNSYLSSVDAELLDIGENRTGNYFEMTTLPAIASSYEDGNVDYQAVYRLVYKQKAA